MELSPCKWCSQRREGKAAQWGWGHVENLRNGGEIPQKTEKLLLKFPLNEAFES